MDPYENAVMSSKPKMRRNKGQHKKREHKKREDKKRQPKKVEHKKGHHKKGHHKKDQHKKSHHKKSQHKKGHKEPHKPLYIQNFDAVEKVFQLDELREMILTFLIYNIHTTRGDICFARLVNKVWLKDVSRILLKSQSPLYHLILTKNNSLNDSPYVRKHGVKLLEKFTSTVLTSPSRIENFVPPFRLTLGIDYFCHENHQSFYNFLTNGSSVRGLVQLELLVPMNGGSMSFAFPCGTISFPVLGKIIVVFRPEDVEFDDNAHGSNSNFIPFLQLIMDESKKMKQVAFHDACPAHSPPEIEHLIFPSNLKSLILNCVINNDHLDGLIRNPFCSLHSLSLQTTPFAVSTGALFHILNHVKATLQKLVLLPIPCVHRTEITPTNIRLPLMAHLEILSVSNFHVELEGNPSALQSVLPKLKHLALNQTVEKLCKWSDRSSFPNITTLSIRLAKKSRNLERMVERERVLHSERVNTLYQAFPNVSALDLVIDGNDFGIVEHAFLEMRQLSKLSIVVREAERYTTSHYWDNLLVGVSTDLIRAYPNVWPPIDPQERPSIRNLTALESLELIADVPLGKNVTNEPSLISDTLFNMALLKMPTLRSLLLTGKFKASRAMQQVWRSKRRTVYYAETVPAVYPTG